MVRRGGEHRFGIESGISTVSASHANKITDRLRDELFDVARNVGVEEP